MPRKNVAVAATAGKWLTHHKEDPTHKQESYLGSSTDPREMVSKNPTEKSGDTPGNFSDITTTEPESRAADGN